MSTRRTYIGRLNGNFVVRTTLPGYNAVTDDVTDPDKFSFSSDWTDLCQIHAIGIGFSYNVNSTGWTDIPFPALPYIPYVEVRWLSGNVVYDDYTPQTSTGLHSGWNQRVLTDKIRLFYTNFDYYNLFTVYKVPVLSG